MNYDEIIKALECCTQDGSSCRECCFDKENECIGLLSRNAIDLIKRQNAEIERLSDRNHKCVYLSDDETTEFCVDGPCPVYKTIAEIKSEAIKEFAERLKERLERKYTIYGREYVLRHLRCLVKEMTEEFGGKL